MRFLGFVFAVAAMLAATKASAAPEEIEFSDLADPLAVVFDDPYRDMGFQLLNELKLILQVDERLSQNDFPEDERARLEARRTAAKDMLEINGYDVDELIAQRWEVARKRKAALMATNPALDKVEVTLSGYLIPAPQAADGTYYGYLVSQVGMCSHLPPPPPNELVRVKLKEDPQGQSLYVPVQVSGLLRVEASDATIFILDGESRMFSGWTLDANTVDQREDLRDDSAVNAFHQTFTNGIDLAASTEKVQPITWRNLVPQVEIDSDPFLELTSDQKLDLVIASRIRELQSEGVDITPEQMEKLTGAVKRLEEDDIDIDGLIALRGEIVAQRTHAMAAVNGTLDGKQVRLAGYVLPLGTGGPKVTEFLLVPWVGACIHTPPPPPNQMIHVSVPGGMEPRGQFSPVWIEGTIEVKPASYDLFLVDGSMQVKVAYTMVTDVISDYSAADSDDLAKVEIPESAFEGHSWFQICAGEGFPDFHPGHERPSRRWQLEGILVRDPGGFRLRPRAHAWSRPWQGGGDLLLCWRWRELGQRLKDGSVDRGLSCPVLDHRRVGDGFCGEAGHRPGSVGLPRHPPRQLRPDHGHRSRDVAQCHPSLETIAEKRGI